MSKPIPITEHRTGERRADWHTPADCYKLLDAQTAMDGINKRLDDGSARMGRIEDTIEANHRKAGVDRRRLEDKLDANSAATNELLEIIQMGKGFFRGVAFAGRWFRKILMWVLPLATAIVSFWWAITGHVPPK